MHFHTELYVEFKKSKMNVEAESKDADCDWVPARRKSVIWEYFSRTSRGTVTCNRETDNQCCHDFNSEIPVHRSN